MAAVEPTWHLTHPPPVRPVSSPVQPNEASTTPAMAPRSHWAWCKHLSDNLGDGPFRDRETTGVDCHGQSVSVTNDSSGKLGRDYKLGKANQDNEKTVKHMFITYLFKALSGLNGRQRWKS